MAKVDTGSAQVDASTNRNAPPSIYLSGGNLYPPTLWWSNVLGVAPVDTGAMPFPTIPAGFNANHHFYPGMGRSYLAAGYVESPSHRQIQMATEDINTIQLSIRGPISADVLARWQMALTGPGAIV